MNEITPQWMIDQGFSKTFAERFWRKVDKNGPIPRNRPELGPCWIWTGAKNTRGYGNILKAWVKYNIVTGAHQASWMLHFGPIPPETPCVLHHCDNPPCVMPQHLFVGTHADNSQDMVRKYRHSFGERSPAHKLTETQVFYIRESHPEKSARQLAAELGVTRQTISEIINGEIWRHLLPS